MNQFEKLKIMNETTIEYLGSLGYSSERNKIIKEILEDEACFFKMDKNDAYTVLESIGVLDTKIKDIYLELISTDNYYYLLKNNKINQDDNEVIIKYPLYNSEDMFKNKYNVKQYEESNNQLTVIDKKENLWNRVINKIKVFFTLK